MMSPTSDAAIVGDGILGGEEDLSNPPKSSQPVSSLEIEQPLPSVAEITGRASTDEIQRRSINLIPVLVILVVIVIALSIGLALGLTQQNQTNQSNGETANEVVDLQKRYEEVLYFLKESKVSDIADLETDGSPQQLAATFMAMLDPLALPVPHSHIITVGYQFITRYVLMVLYFATDGEQWTKQRHFRSELPTCEWWELNLDQDTSPLYQYTGVICNEQGIISSLLLRK